MLSEKNNQKAKFRVIIPFILEWIKNHPTVRYLTLILIIAVFLRFYTIGAESVWLDEAESIRESQLSIQGIAHSSNQPPLYFLILRVWIFLFGTSEFAIRSLSAIFGVLSVVAIYVAGTALYNKTIGLISAFLASFSAFLILNSQDARAYSLLLLLSTLSYWLFIEILNKNKKKYYIAYTITSILLIYTHIFSMFLIASQILFYLIFIKKYSFRRLNYLIPFGILIFSIIPMAWLLRNNISSIANNGFWIPEVSNLNFINTLIMFSGSGILRYVIFTAFFILAMLGILIVQHNTETNTDTTPKLNKYINNIRANYPEKFVLLAFWLFITILIPFLISKLVTPIYQERYVIGAYPALAIVVANGISKLHSKRLIIPLLITIVLLSSFGLYNYYKYDSKDQWRDTAQFIEINSQPEDIIVIYQSYQQVPLNYYYKGNLTKYGINSPDDAVMLIDSLESDNTHNNNRLWLILSSNNKELYDFFVDYYGIISIDIIQEYVGLDIILFDTSHD